MKYIVIAIILGLATSTLAQRSVINHVRPDSTIDLRTETGVSLVSGQWKYADARIVEVDHRAVGVDLRASGAPTRTNDIEPKAGLRDFNDSTWESLPPTSLEARRTNGRLAFGWYRINITVPERADDFDPTGSTIYFEIVADDYAEVWVDGKLPQVLGSTGGRLINGWNAPNRVLLTRDAKPRQSFQLAIFVANGPLSDPPANFVWIRSATLDFYKPQNARVGVDVETTIERFDPAIDSVIRPDAKIEKLADGVGFTEGPVWVRGSDASAGYLLFSDPNNNTIYRWDSTDGQVSVFRSHSGYTGTDIGRYHQPGSNGLALDREGRLTICEHGNRRVTRLAKNGTITVLADKFDGKRLNSPNDLVYRSDGTLYFTDPPFGLPQVFDDPSKELPFSGVYMLKDGQLTLAAKDLAAPNGLAFSPDEKHLYVDNWQEQRKVILRYDVQPDGVLSNPTTFFDFTSITGEIALDGLKVDERGNVYVSGPGGVSIISGQGKLLGRINGPELPANFAWGDADNRTLYLCARHGLYRLRMSVSGAGRDR